MVDASKVPFDSGLVAWGNPAFGGDLGAMQPLLMSATELRIYGAFEGWQDRFHRRIARDSTIERGMRVTGKYLAIY